MTFRRSLAALAAASLMGGGACTTTRVIQRPEVLPSDKGIVQATGIVATFDGEPVDVALAAPGPDQRGPGGSVRTGRLAVLDGRSFYLYEESQRSPSNLLFQDTRSFSRNDHVQGAGYGFLGGAIAGGLMGALLGASVSGLGCDSDLTPPRCPSTVGPAIAGGLLGGLLVGGLGAAVGAAVGHRTTLSF